MVTRKTLTPGAERQRRYKRHKAGDHSLCLPGKCDHAGQPSEVPPPPAPEPTRGARGARLWRVMASSGLGPVHRLLLEEACRIADRLDRLDAIIEGREDWLRIDVSDSGSEIRVSVDALLAETRQQETALRGIVAELRAAGATKAVSGSVVSGSAGQPPAKGGLSALADELAARRGKTAG